MSEPEWSDYEFESFDMSKSAIGRAIEDAKAILAEHRDDNAPAWIVTPQSADPEELDRCARIGAYLNHPDTIERMRKEYTRRLLFGH